MNKRKRLVRLISALGLFIALMLPTAIQFVHVFGVHEHFVCNDRDSHVHETPVKCEICTVQVAPFDPNLPPYPATRSPEFETLLADDLPVLQFEVFIYNSNPHRGPPLFS